MPQPYAHRPAHPPQGPPPLARYNSGMEMRSERIVLETDRHRIVGDLMLPREGYRSRLSDYLNHGDGDFVPLVNCEIRSLNGGEAQRRQFLAVARNHVQLAYQYEPE